MFTLCRQMPFQNDFCCGQASCPNCSDAIGNTDSSHFAPLKKVEQSDFGIHFVKSEQHETKQGSGKNKVFLLKVLILKLSNYNNHFSGVLVVHCVKYARGRVFTGPYSLVQGQNLQKTEQ